MFQFAIHSVGLFKPVLFQLRLIGACSVLGLCGWSLAACIMDVARQAKKMHSIPCTKCRFFTGDYRLKCTANPSIANTEQAIHCGDYQETSNS
ncbi:hypothetical protein IQ255_08555 [Pleurocapsales cyanobacterium LEGE 10410]|nr:hypothetical protein [Pleurocapsales cyanobacterium LEGE 10410]